MKLLRKIFRDLRQGENLEVYLTLVVALALLILDVFGVASTEAIAAGTLATLALLAFSTLTNREQTQRLARAAEQAVLGRSSADDFFWEESHLGEQDFEGASFIGLVGITLSKTVARYESVFENRLASGAHIRVITIDPTTQAPQQAIDRSAGIVGQTFFVDLLKPTVDRLCSLANAAHPSTNLELGLLPFIPSFGLILIDPDQRDGRIIVEIYQHKSSALHPTFELRPHLDERWYGFFKEQFDLLWKSCGDRRAAGQQIHQFRQEFQPRFSGTSDENRDESRP